MNIKKYQITFFFIMFFNFSVHAEKFIPGWAWGLSPESPSPEEACQYAISVADDKGWRFYDAIEYEYSPSPQEKLCRATHVNYGDFIYGFTFVHQIRCPEPEPLYVEHIEASGLRSCNRYTATISGPSVTQALPSFSGPITQFITINSDDGPVKNWSVQIEIINASGPATVGWGLTNHNGVFEFVYVPPAWQAAISHISATCVACENTASKTITVLAVDLPPDHQSIKEPQICRR